MTATILEAAGLDPTYAIGGIARRHRQETSAQLASGAWFVDPKAMRATGRSCTCTRRSRLVITNIENDHLASDDELPQLAGEQFLQRFVQRSVPPDGRAIVGFDNCAQRVQLAKNATVLEDDVRHPRRRRPRRARHRLRRLRLALHAGRSSTAGDRAAGEVRLCASRARSTSRTHLPRQPRSPCTPKIDVRDDRRGSARQRLSPQRCGGASRFWHAPRTSRSSTTTRIIRPRSVRRRTPPRAATIPGATHRRRLPAAASLFSRTVRYLCKAGFCGSAQRCRPGRPRAGVRRLGGADRRASANVSTWRTARRGNAGHLRGQRQRFARGDPECYRQRCRRVDARRRLDLGRRASPGRVD